MICQELETLERKLIEIRSAQRRHDFTEEQMDEMLGRERLAIMEIKDHKAFGHPAEQPCPGD